MKRQTLKQSKYYVTRAMSALVTVVFAAASAFTLSGCEEEEQPAAGAPPKYLYVASGACYSGNGVTAFTNATSSNLVYRLNLATGTKERTIADYFASPANPGDSPVSIVSENSSSLLVLIENTTTVGLRRIERVSKTGTSSRTTYSGNITALSAQARAMTLLPDGYLLVSKSTAIEKMKDGSNRLLKGANPWVSLSTPASSCTTSATLLSDVVRLNNGGIVFAHAATGTARIGVVDPLGYAVAGDCKSAQSSPNAASFPTAMAYDRTNHKLIVAYAGNTTAADINTIYSYDVDETTNVLSNPQELYDSSLFGSTYNYLLFGVSSMTLDTTNGYLYVATAVSTATTAANYKIEKLKYAPTNIGSNNPAVLSWEKTFYDFGGDTKCISSMTIAD